jgi:hypothetical protein
MFARSLARPMAAFGLALVVAACSGATNAPGPTGGAPSSAGGPSGAASSPASGGPGTDRFEGSITTSGLYAATWTAAPGVNVYPFNASGNLTLASDKGTAGNIVVNLDGSLDFGSAAPELGKDLTFTGTGAHVTLDATKAFVCAFTVDTDLKGTTDGAVLHVSGGMTAHWYTSGAADLLCP